MDTNEEDEGEKGEEEQGDDTEDEEGGQAPDGCKRRAPWQWRPHEEELRQADQALKEENITTDEANIPTPFAYSSV